MRAIYAVTVAAIAVLLVTVSLRGYVAKPSTAKPAPVALLVEPPPAKSDRLSIPKPPPPPPKPVPPPPPVAELIEPPLAAVAAAPAPKPHADPVCGARGRAWYTRENGWKYWRCVR
jgi:hypothetical protein